MLDLAKPRNRHCIVALLLFCPEYIMRTAEYHHQISNAVSTQGLSTCPSLFCESFLGSLDHSVHFPKAISVYT